MSLSSLVSDVAYQVFSNLDYNSIVALCQASSQYTTLCQNNLFWITLLRLKYPGLPYPGSISSKEAFYSFDQRNTLIIEPLGQMFFLSSLNPEVILGGLVGYTLVRNIIPIVGGFGHATIQAKDLIVQGNKILQDSEVMVISPGGDTSITPWISKLQMIDTIPDSGYDIYYIVHITYDNLELVTEVQGLGHGFTQAIEKVVKHLLPDADIYVNPTLY